MTKEQMIFPNEEVRAMWPDMYDRVKHEVKNEYNSQVSFEDRMRTYLKEKLGAEKIKTEEAYRNFFKAIIRLAIGMDTDKVLSRITGGRARYGENRHSTGKIKPVDPEMNFD